MIPNFFGIFEGYSPWNHNPKVNLDFSSILFSLFVILSYLHFIDSVHVMIQSSISISFSIVFF